VTAFEATPGEMLRRGCGDAQLAARQAVTLPPVKLVDILQWHAPRLQVRADAEGGDERYVAPTQRAYGGIVEVIVVVVRDDHEIQRRQRVHGHGNRLKALRTDDARR